MGGWEVTEIAGDNGRMGGDGNSWRSMPGWEVTEIAEDHIQ
jgi:hypothetical protein